MSLRILVPYDGSEQAVAALEYACSLFGDDELLVLAVADSSDIGYGPGAPESLSPGAVGEAALEDMRQRLDRARAIAAEAGVEIDTVVEVGSPERIIVEYATSADIDHIVMGTHGRTGLSRVLLGSVAETVARRAPVPVTIV